MSRLIRFLLRLIFLVAVLFVLLVGWIIYDGSRDGGATADCAGWSWGAPLASDGQPGAVLQARLDRAVALYKAQKFSALILCGGSDGTTEGAPVVSAMVQYLIKQQIPDGALLQDASGTSVDTAAHDVALYVKQQNLQSVMVITHYYDVTRMKIALKREGVPQITQEHVGVVGAADILLPIASAVQLLSRYVQHDAMPQSRQLIATFETGAISLKQKVIAEANSEPIANGPFIEAKAVANFSAPHRLGRCGTMCPGRPFRQRRNRPMGHWDAYLMVGNNNNTDSLDAFVAIAIIAEGRRALSMDSEKAEDFTTLDGGGGAAGQARPRSSAT